MILHGNCLDILPMLDADSFDSCVCDPPYGLSFMNKHWDHDVPSVEIWREVYRVLKPGAHLLAFFGTRTYHRGVVNIEDAGFEIRDQVQWLYGSGFPKSHDVSKAIDKMAGAEREVLSEGKPVKRMIPGADQDKTGSWIKDNGRVFVPTETAPATAEAAQWEGWGTALKPAHEPIVVARKPLIGTVAENVLAYGVGGLNIDGCRVETADDLNGGAYSQERKPSDSEWVKHGGTIHSYAGKNYEQPEGRWPANIIHDGSDEVLAAFPVTTSGAMKRVVEAYDGESATGFLRGRSGPHNQHGGSGSAARFFYCAKSSKSDRDDGLAEFAAKPSAASEFRPNHTEKAEQGEDGNPYGRWKPPKNHHPTVKPTDLMRYLCRLVTPPGGKVLDPFAGSGSTGRGAVLEGFQFTGIEMSEEFVEIARARIAAARKRYEDEVYL